MEYIVALTLIGVLVQQPASIPPKDFAVRIEFGLCWNESVDTGRQVFARRIQPDDVRTVPIQLSEKDRTQLYQIVRSVNLFDYPEEFEPPLTFMREPAPEYEIEVQSEGRRHVVRWQDYGSTSPEANRLRDMLMAAHRLFAALPAVKQLPPSEMFCL